MVWLTKILFKNKESDILCYINNLLLFRRSDYTGGSVNGSCSKLDQLCFKCAKMFLDRDYSLKYIQSSQSICDLRYCGLLYTWHKISSLLVKKSKYLLGTWPDAKFYAELIKNFVISLKIDKMLNKGTDLQLTDYIEGKSWSVQ